jgi:hypothetical protein
MIQADAMYTTGDLRRIGLGTTMLGRARRAGVSAVRVGKSDWYYGRDLIAWMKDMDRSASDCEVAAVATAGTDSGHDAPFFKE